MRATPLERYRYAMRDTRWRRVFMALALTVVLVQTGFPAHQDSHPIGSTDNLCQYCVLAGHSIGVPGMAVLPPVVPGHIIYRVPVPVAFHIPVFPRTRFSRAPPSNPVV